MNDRLIYIGQTVEQTDPMKSYNIIAIILLVTICFGTFAQAATLVTTTMTWVVPTIKSITIAYGSPCTSTAFFFVESNAQFDADADANWARAVPQATRIGLGDTNCQSSSQAAFTVTNAGNTALNLDGNFTSTISGADVNVELKIWLGSSGCGTNGLGGWEEPCSVTGATTAPTTSTCKEYSSSSAAATTGTRIASSLAVFTSQQFCVSGDFNNSNGGSVSGDHNLTYQIGSVFS